MFLFQTLQLNKLIPLLHFPCNGFQFCNSRVDPRQHLLVDLHCHDQQVHHGRVQLQLSAALHVVPFPDDIPHSRADVPHSPHRARRTVGAVGCEMGARSGLRWRRCVHELQSEDQLSRLLPTLEALLHPRHRRVQLLRSGEEDAASRARESRYSANRYISVHHQRHEPQSERVHYRCHCGAARCDAADKNGHIAEAVQCERTDNAARNSVQTVRDMRMCWYYSGDVG